MATPFESVARVALDEILRKHMVASKFGMFLSDEALGELQDELYDFLVTSRNLRSAGDRFMVNAQRQQARARATGAAALPKPSR